MNSKSVLGQHWSEGIHDVVLSLSISAEPPFKVVGGSENAAFLYISQLRSEKLTYLRGNERLVDGELILELQNEKVGGWTSYDAQRLFDDCCRRGGPFSLKTLKPGLLPEDLRVYLKHRFEKGSADHELQNIIRDNVYSKTVPCTTREPREGEIDGDIYRFISREEFEALQRNGELLESGIYEGNFYGTPVPPKVEEYELDAVEHPRSGVSSRGTEEEHRRKLDERRRRNRTDFDEMAPLFISEMKHNRMNVAGTSMGSEEHQQQPASSTSTNATAEAFGGYSNGVEDGLGPLPSNWEIGYTETGEKYFIDHNAGTTQWNDPRKERLQSNDNENVDALPPGWERVDDPQYGVYYVDHVNKKTQYEKPTISQLGHAGNNGKDVGGRHTTASVQLSSSRRTNSVPDIARKATRSPHKALFTLNPRELRGELITATLLKSPKGLGFTLVGNDGNTSQEEFLQIRNVIRDGAADKDGRLRMGDILVYVNNTCVLGYSQNDIIRTFQSINVGESVTICVCRGYPLLFDASTGNDVITQDAYSISGSDASASPLTADLSGARSETIAIRITKGDMGFGFTIADGPYGQKVKKILDKPRCRGLTEGDVLCEINGYNVRKMGHAEIVDVLKECPVGLEAVLLVQRTFGAMKRSQTEISGAPQKPPSVPAKPLNRPHSYHPSYNGGGDWDRRAKTPTADIARLYLENNGSGTASDGGPSVRPRSKTPGPLPSRPQKPNGYMPNGSNGPYIQRYDSSGFGAPIYENLPRQARYNDMPSASPTGGRPKTPSSSSFASATPNYVPAAVYRHYASGGGVGGSVAKAPAEPVARYSPAGSGYAEQREQDNYDYVVVNLIRQPSGFGFRVIGGTEEGSQTSVGQIVPAGAAEKDGRLKMADEIIEIDGMPMFGASHQDAVRAMSAASQVGYVKLVVRRKRNGSTVSTAQPAVPEYHPTMRHASAPTRSYPFDVTVTRADSEGFGFQIVSSDFKTGTCIGKIIEGSPAARCGNLRVNDRIIAINGMNILGMHHGDIVGLIQASGNVVTLTVGAPDQNALLSAPIVSSSNVVPGPREMSAMEQRYSLSSVIENIEAATPPASEMLEYRYEMIVSEPPSPDGFPQFGSLHQHLGQGHSVHESSNEANYQACFAVELQRGNKGFGFSIRGGQEFSSMPLFVLRIAEGGPAHLDGGLEVGDQLVEINGISTVGMTHAEAIELIKREPTVRLLVKRQPNSILDANAFVDAMQEGPYGRLGNGTNAYPTYATNYGPDAHSNQAWSMVR